MSFIVNIITCKLILLIIYRCGLQKIAHISNCNHKAIKHDTLIP